MISQKAIKLLMKILTSTFILQLLWHVIFSPIMSIITLYYFFFSPKNIFWLHTALFWFGYILYVASRKIYYKLPKQPLVDLFHHFLLFQLSGVEIMSSALLPKPSVQVFSCKSPVGFLKPHGSYLMASQRRMW